MAAWSLAALLLAAAANARATDGPPAPVFDVYTAPDGQTLDVEWHLPAGEVQALVTLQHGFARRCANLRTLARTLAAAGFATLCVNADLARGAPVLARALARDLAATGALPDGRALPPDVVAAGHSAGGLFAAHLAAHFVAHSAVHSAAHRATQPATAPVPQTTAPPALRLAGVLLLDPVGGADLAAALQAVRSTAAPPVLALLAPPSRCNARQMARPALEAAAATVIDIADGIHLDAEGADAEALAVWSCREGAPRSAAVQRLQDEALGFVRAVSARPASPAPRSP
jgi:hypothetical protein